MTQNQAGTFIPFLPYSSSAQPRQGLRRRLCPYCAQYSFAPCGSPQQSDSCRQMQRMTHIEAIAHSRQHAARRSYSLLLAVYIQRIQSGAVTPRIAWAMLCDERAAREN